MDEIRRIMKPNGQFLFIEWEVINSEMGPPVHERIASSNLLAYLKTKTSQVEFIRFHPAIYGVLIHY